MRIRHLLLALLVSSLAVAALTGFDQQVVTAQITFVQAPQNRNQTQTQDQNQRGLPPEKKRSLSRYGPEDAFPGASQQEENRRQNTGSRQKSQRASASKPAPTPRRSPTPAVTLIATPSPAIAQAAKPSPTMIAARGNQFQPPSPTQQSSSASPWAVPILSGLALIVSIALIYVLTKLIEKIREDSRV